VGELFLLPVPKKLKNISEEEKRRLMQEELWYRGDLEYLLREQSQVPAYQFVHNWKTTNPDRLGPIVWNNHRRWGKSFALVCLCVERCLRYPNQEVRFGAPTFKQAVEIVQPLLRSVLNHCPEDMYPEKTGGRYKFNNPRWGLPHAESALSIVSCKEGADDQRGLASDMVVLDECRDIDDLAYVIESVFLYHFSGRPNPLFILSSTPPNTTDHPWIDKLYEAHREQRYFTMSVEQNKDFTKRDEEMLLAVCKTKESTTWRREALCEIVADEAAMIIPEFPRAKDITVVDSWPRPEWFFPHMAVDFGWIDMSAVLFGYIDFKNQLLIIEDEYVENYKTIGQIAAAIKEKEKNLGYPDLPYPIRRFGDNDQLELANLRIDYQIPISSAEKYDRESAIALLRTKFQEGRIRIYNRCKNLIYQLENGLKDPKGKFVRTEKCGHCDAIASLVYMNRMINWQANPYPFRPHFNPDIFNLWEKKPLGTGTVRITKQPIPIFGRKWNGTYTGSSGSAS
jgi:hypothetical protein